MSEERFILDSDFVKVTSQVVWDNQEEKGLTLMKLVNLLNEQQATIEHLKAQLREKEEDEKLYANEILELRETNKEHIKFKSLGGNY